MYSKPRKQSTSVSRAGYSKSTNEDPQVFNADVNRFALPQLHRQMTPLKHKRQEWRFLEMHRHLGIKTQTEKVPSPPMPKGISNVNVNVSACAKRLQESQRRNYFTFEQLFKRHVATARAPPQDGQVSPHKVAPRLLSRARLDGAAGEMMKTLGVETFLRRVKKSSPIDTELSLLPDIAESGESLSPRESLTSQDFSYYGVPLPDISDCTAKFKKGQRLRGWGKKKGKNK